MNPFFKPAKPEPKILDHSSADEAYPHTRQLRKQTFTKNINNLSISDAEKQKTLEAYEKMPMGYYKLYQTQGTPKLPMCKHFFEQNLKPTEAGNMEKEDTAECINEFISYLSCK